MTFNFQKVKKGYKWYYPNGLLVDFFKQKFFLPRFYISLYLYQAMIGVCYYKI